MYFKSEVNSNAKIVKSQWLMFLALQLDDFKLLIHYSTKKSMAKTKNTLGTADISKVFSWEKGQTHNLPRIWVLSKIQFNEGPILDM